MINHRLFLRRLKCLRPLAVLSSAFASVYLLLWGLLLSAVHTDYTQETLINLPSATGEWIAFVSEESVDASILSHTSDFVKIVSTAYPTWSMELVWIDTGGHDENRPRIAWSAPNVLRVTLANKSINKVLTRHADGINIDIRFDPDDPAARAAWLKHIGEPPE
jgi:hypothetical protein